MNVVCKNRGIVEQRGLFEVHLELEVLVVGDDCEQGEVWMNSEREGAPQPAVPA